MGIAEDQVSVGEPLPAAWRLAEAIAARELSCVELVEACLERIAAEDADLRAWSFVDADGARAQARGLDGERPRGPLHGLPVGVKDIIDVAGLPCELGSPITRVGSPGGTPTRSPACAPPARSSSARR